MNPDTEIDQLQLKTIGTRLPNFLIIGAQKAGSTWLYETLKQHSQIFLPEKVECHHFSHAECGCERRIIQYKKHFSSVKSSHKAVGEKTPGYFWSVDDDRPYCKPGSLHNRSIPSSVIQQLGPDVKLICSFRHPVWRAISAFFHHVQRDRIAPDTSISTVFQELGIIDIGFYSKHLLEWQRYFRKSQFFSVLMERDIILHPVALQRKLSTFLAVDYDDSIKGLKNQSNKGKCKRIYRQGRIMLSMPNSPYVSPQDVGEMLDIYRTSMIDLREALDDELVEWKRIDQALERYSRSARTQISVGKNKPLDEVHSIGVDISQKSLTVSCQNSVVEVPARLSNGAMVHQCKFGAFSYMVDGTLYSTEVGRYCSIARDVNIVQGNHQTNWLGSSPFQYDQSFRFKCGDSFTFDKEYKAFSVSPDVRKAGLEQLRNPPTKIGNDVWIGHGVVIMAGIQIGDGAVIGAGAVVTKDVGPFSIVAGVPAKVIGARFDQLTIHALLKCAWWQYAQWDLQDVPFHDVHAAIECIETRKRQGLLIPYFPAEVKLTNSKDL